MKNLRLVGMAIALAAFAAGAKSLTVHHSQTGDGTDPKDAKTSKGIFAQELAAAAAEAGISLSDVTELTIISDKLPLTEAEQAKIEAGEELADKYAEFNEYDIYDFRAYSGGMFKTNITKVDLSQLVCADNHLPTNEPPYLYGNTGTFTDFNQLKECILPEGITGIPGAAFMRCSNLETVNLPDGINTIPQNGFSGCTKLKLTSLPPNLIGIYSGAFKGCESVTFSELPATVKEILADAFNDCPNVTFSEFPPELTVIGDRAFRNTGVTFTTFPETLVHMYNDEGNITRPGLGKAAFVNAPITEFTIPDVVGVGLWTEIPDQTFWLGDVERTFVCRSLVPPKAAVESGSYTGVFGGSKTFPKITFKVLAEALAQYKAKAPYSTMKLEVLTAPVPPISMALTVEELNNNRGEVKDGHIICCYEIADNEYTDLSAIPETSDNMAMFKVKFASNAILGLYVKEIRYAPAETPAEARAIRRAADDEGEEFADEDEDPEAGDDPEPDDSSDILYTAPDSPVHNEAVSVPVDLTDPRPLKVTVAKADIPTGVEVVDAPEAKVTRVGDEIYLNVAGATLYDLAGRVVASTDSNALSMSALPEGIYILRAGKTVQKIVK